MSTATTARLILEVPLTVATPESTPPTASNRFDEVFLRDPINGGYQRVFIGLSDDGTSTVIKSEPEAGSPSV